MSDEVTIWAFFFVDRGCFLLLLLSVISPSLVPSPLLRLFRGGQIILGEDRRKIRDVWGHFTNEAKTNKKQGNRTDLGSNLVYAGAGGSSTKILSFLALLLFKCLSSVSVLIMIL